MQNTMRRGNILKDANSELIEQKFLVLKDSAPDGGAKVIREAEKIVEKYMGKKPEKKRNENKKKRASAWWVSVISFGLGMLATKFFV